MTFFGAHMSIQLFFYRISEKNKDIHVELKLPPIQRAITVFQRQCIEKVVRYGIIFFPSILTKTVFIDLKPNS